MLVISKLVTAAYVSLIVSYSSIFFWALFNWHLHGAPDMKPGQSRGWFRASWTMVSAGATLLSTHALFVNKSPVWASSLILIVAQALLILAAVSAQTGFQIARQGSGRVFWFSLAVPVTVLVCFVVGSL